MQWQARESEGLWAGQMKSWQQLFFQRQDATAFGIHSESRLATWLYVQNQACHYCTLSCHSDGARLHRGAADRVAHLTSDTFIYLPIR